MLKSAALAPIASPMDRIAATANPGLRLSVRMA
jgi:hypothetical protein